MSKKSKTTQTSTIDPYTQGAQRSNYESAVQRFGGATYNPLGAEDISRYMNPFRQDVIDTSLQTLGDQEKRTINGNNDAAIRAGAFGGSGSAVQNALTQGEFDKNRGSLVAGLNSANYTQALNTAQGENTAKNNFPLLIQQLLNGTLAGVTPNVTQTGVTKTSDPLGQLSQILQAAGAAAQGAAALSDMRLKTDVQTVGYDHAGRRIVDFKYLWSDQVYRGHIAQEILESDPHAVEVDPSGFLMIHYGKLN